MWKEEKVMGWSYGEEFAKTTYYKPEGEIGGKESNRMIKSH